MRAIWLIILASMAHAAPPQPPRVEGIVVIEENGATQVGEGSKWIARYYKDGCWQRELEGSNGASQVRDSEAGCGAKSVVAFFEKCATLELTPWVPKPAPSKRGGAPFGREAPELTFIDATGRRWQANGAKFSHDDLELPTWYAEVPKPPVGNGPQLIAFNVTHGESRVQATMTASGIVWCHRSVPAGKPLALPGRPKLVSAADASKLLLQFLPGLDAKSFEGDGESELEAALPDVARAGVKKKSVTSGAVKRFVTTMSQYSYPCQ